MNFEGHTSLFERNQLRNRLFENAFPELDFKYFSNRTALSLSLNAQYHSIPQGLYWEVCLHPP